MPRPSDGSPRRRPPLWPVVLIALAFVLIGTVGRVDDPVRLGNDLVAAGHPRAAALAYRWATETRPEDPAAWMALGRLRAEAGDTDGALRAYRSLAEVESEDGWVVAFVAKRFAKAGRHDEALAMLTEATSRPVKKADDLMNAVRGILEPEGRADEALEILARAEKRAGGDTIAEASAAGNRAVILANLGRADEARAIADRIVERHGDTALAWYYSAQARAIVGDRGTSLDHLEATIARDFHHPCWLEQRLSESADYEDYAAVATEPRFEAVKAYGDAWKERLRAKRKAKAEGETRS